MKTYEILQQVLDESFIFNEVELVSILEKKITSVSMTKALIKDINFHFFSELDSAFRHLANGELHEILTNQFERLNGDVLSKSINKLIRKSNLHENDARELRHYVVQKNSFSELMDLINQIAIEKKFMVSSETNAQQLDPIFEWQLNQVDLVELIKALIEIRAVKFETEEELYNRFSKVFGIKLNHTYALQNIKKRKNQDGHLTYKLLKELEGWIQRTDERNRTSR